jgi:tetratricopeptide (TPR) repeat protein
MIPINLRSLSGTTADGRRGRKSLPSLGILIDAGLHRIVSAAHRLGPRGFGIECIDASNAASGAIVRHYLCSIDVMRNLLIRLGSRRLFDDSTSSPVNRDALLAEAYNRNRVGHRRHCLLSHDDVDILTSDFARRLQAHLSRFDVVGVMGAAEMSGPTWNWSRHPHLRGWITHHLARDADWRPFVVDPRPVAGDVVVLDGVLIAAHRKLFDKVKFDEETFDGFHLYDTDWSYRAAKAGFRMAAAGDLLVVHASGGRYDVVWEDYAHRFCDKHSLGERDEPLAPPLPWWAKRRVCEMPTVRAFFGRSRPGCRVSPRIVDRTVTSCKPYAAVEQYRAGDYRQALALVSRALSFDPTSAEAHCFRGDTYRAIGELEDAVASYRAAISLNPNYSEAFNNLGVTLAAQGRVEDALASFESALACRPGYVDAQINLGNAYLDLGRLQDAIACHEKAMAMNPDSGVACIMLGRAFQLSGRDSEALLKYQEGLAIDPNIAEGHIFLGHMLQQE